MQAFRKMGLSVRTKLLGGFVVVLLLMGATLAVALVANGNQAAISNRIVNHLDPARIAAAKIVTLVRSIDDDGAWAVNSMSGDKAHSDQLLKTYYAEVDQLKSTVSDANDPAAARPGTSSRLQARGRGEGVGRGRPQHLRPVSVAGSK
jgi:hypothetical protein